MKKTNILIISIMLAVLTSPLVNAELERFEIPYESYIDEIVVNSTHNKISIDTNLFDPLNPNHAFSKFRRMYFYAENNCTLYKPTNSDLIGSVILFLDINKTAICNDTSFYSLAADMGEVCKQVLLNINQSQEYSEKYVKANEASSEYQRLWKIEEDRRASCDVIANTSRTELNNCKVELETAQRQANRATQDSAALATCQQQLETTKKSNSNGIIIAFAMGGGLGWFMWGKKRRAGPSEQSMARSYSDNVEYRDFDEPRQ